MRRQALLVALVLVPTVADAGFRVSSFKKETRLGANFWNVAAALDAKPETCWMVDPEADNVGQWIEVDLPKGTVDKLSVQIGWAKDQGTYKDYTRVKSMRVQVYNTLEEGDKLVADQEVTFEDQYEPQVVDFPDTEIGSDLFGGKLKATITSTYEGDDYPTVALSEFLILLKEMDAKAKVSSELGAADGHDTTSMLDDNPKTFWVSPSKGDGTNFHVEAPGFGVSSIGFEEGPKTHARPKTVEIVANDVTRRYTLEDKAGTQWFLLPAVTGYTGSTWGDVSVTLIDSYPGSTTDAAAIAEVKLKATNYEGF